MSQWLERVEAADALRRRRGLSITDFDITSYLDKNPEKHDLINPLDLVDEAIKRQKRGGKLNGPRTPWPKADNCIRFRESEVTLWAGINGHGKSLLTGQIALSLVEQGFKVMIASMEMRPVTTFERQAHQAIGNQEPTDGAWNEFASWLSGSLWYYTPQGIVEPRKLLAACRFAFEKLGVTHVFIDSLMKLTREADDYSGQKRIVTDLCSLGRDTGVHVHLVAHIRKSDKEVGGVPDKFDVGGSGDVTNQVDNVMIVYHVKEEQIKKAVAEGRSDHSTVLKCCKNRHGGWEGSLLLWFDPRSEQFLESKGADRHIYLPSQLQRVDWRQNAGGNQ